MKHVMVNADPLAGDENRLKRDLGGNALVGAEMKGLAVCGTALNSITINILSIQNLLKTTFNLNSLLTRHATEWRALQNFIANCETQLCLKSGVVG
jgi:hypothetical protein